MKFLKQSPLKLTLFFALNLFFLVENTQAQALLNSEWRSSGTFQTVLQSNFFVDSVYMKFLSNDEFQFVYFEGSGQTIAKGLWYQDDNSHFRFVDTSETYLGLPCPQDTFSIVYSVSGNTLQFDQVENGCTTVSSILIGSSWINTDLTAGINVLNFNKDKAICFPNPAQGGIFYHLNQDSNLTDGLTLEVYNSVGQSILKDVNSNLNGRINLEKVPVGLYFIRFSNHAKSINWVESIILQ
ncbi:MAG TPA: T9SS type A sorting domain-containing protein [Flavobacteriales bacterium]|nr:T9SS type A sorting domain-containing protein [Flavobacteriales bacterium]HPH81774.1 T9SS type A sorting domain-containing protein [Flavobacteriales bacterium]